MSGPDGKLFDPIEGYPLALFHRKRVVGRAQFKARAKVPSTEVYIAFKFGRFGIAVYPCIEPTKPRRLILDDRRVPEFKEAAETFLGYGRPNTPHEMLLTANDRYFKISANITLGTVDYADVIRKF